MAFFCARSVVRDRSCLVNRRRIAPIIQISSLENERGKIMKRTGLLDSEIERKVLLSLELLSSSSSSLLVDNGKDSSDILSDNRARN